MQEVRDVQRLCEVGTFAQIVQLNPTDEGLHVLLRGHRRIKLDGTVQTEPCLSCEVQNTCYDKLTTCAYESLFLFGSEVCKKVLTPPFFFPSHRPTLPPTGRALRAYLRAGGCSGVRGHGRVGGVARRAFVRASTHTCAQAHIFV